MSNQSERLDPSCGAPLATRALSSAEAGPLAAAFKALGDPIRLRLFSMIASADDEVCVCDMTSAFDVTAPTVSHHLKTLRTAGLVTSERRGTWVYYRVVPAVPDQLSRLLSVGEKVA